MARFNAGFSAVELLVTLFIAAAFLIAGHQLYVAIIEDSGASRQKARASNLAYEKLRAYSSKATNPCTNLTPAQNQTQEQVEGLSNVRFTVKISCAASGLASLSRVEAIVYYGENGEVAHAIYTSL